MKKSIRLLLLGCVLSCKETVLHGIDETKANQLSILLERAGVESHKHQSGNSWDLQVESADLSTALRIIDSSRILTRGQSRFKSQESSILPDDSQQLQFAERQLAWSIEETLERIPGVIEAKVHLWLNKPMQIGLKVQDNSARSASALLLTDANTELNNEEIKTLLHGATGAMLDTISVVTRTVPQESLATISPESSSVKNWQFDNSYWKLTIPAFALMTAGWLVSRRRHRKQPQLSPSKISRREFGGQDASS